METEFKPGDRLRSKRSGRIWIFIETYEKPSEFVAPDSIPVRSSCWPEKSWVWMRRSIFDLVQD